MNSKLTWATEWVPVSKNSKEEEEVDQLCWIRVPSSGPHLILITPHQWLCFGEEGIAGDWAYGVLIPLSWHTPPGLTLCFHTLTLAVRAATYRFWEAVQSLTMTCLYRMQWHHQAGRHPVTGGPFWFACCLTYPLSLGALILRAFTGAADACVSVCGTSSKAL